MDRTIEVSAFKQFEHKGWEHSVAAYDKLFGPLTQQLIPHLFDDLIIGKEDKLLDIATGPGYVAAKGHELGCIVTAIDISEAMVAKAKQLLPSAIQLRVGDAEYLPFGKEEFDIIAMNLGILHLAQPDKAAKEAFRALKMGGRFGFTVWAPPEHSIGFSIVLKAIEAHGNSAVKLPAGPPFFRYGEKEQGIGLLTNAGFSPPRARMVRLTWKLPNPDALFEAFYEGTARTGGILRAQPGKDLERIRRVVCESAAKFDKGGQIELPMAAWIYVGEKVAMRSRRSGGMPDHGRNIGEHSA
jgi:SAM-dependent methyltransferase